MALQGTARCSTGSLPDPAAKFLLLDQTRASIAMFRAVTIAQEVKLDKAPLCHCHSIRIRFREVGNDRNDSSGWKKQCLRSERPPLADVEIPVQPPDAKKGGNAALFS